MTGSLPVIDLEDLRSGRTRDVVPAIRAAICDYGFFYVVNHGVQEGLIVGAAEAARSFFALPDGEKEKVHVDGRHRGYLGFGGSRMLEAKSADRKESFVYGIEHAAPEDGAASLLVGPNQWPASVPGFQAHVYSFFLAAIAVGKTVLSGAALALGLSPGFFEPRLTDPLARGSLIHYPPGPAGEHAGRPANLGVGAHTDYGLITVLWQDQVGGLQVRHEEHWLSVPPLPQALVINSGDLLARWSNDRLASAYHRVVSNEIKDRYSMAVFVDPSFETVVDPRDCGLADGEEPHYEAVAVGEHIAARFDSSFAYRKEH
ncbi:MAG TPA: 2OG-Fe(II) oxygenase family protein [Acidimicrobiales bacterium]|nr:2OG-Fe(II) oxygenase family protein [Acidimicrobiales bacterium]